MDFLRPAFEDAVAAFVEGDVVRVGRFSYTPLDIINLAGPAAYNQAFSDWIWDEWIPTRRDRKDTLLKLGANATRFNDLKQMIASGRSIPFVGSGMSCSTGMPTWGKFLRDTCKQTKGFTVKELDTFLASGDFEGAASGIFGGMPSQLFNERFEGNFTLKSSQVIGGPVQLLPYLFDSTVITTNFDGILEFVYGSAEKPFQVTLYGMSIADFRKKVTLGSRCLLKLHGDYAASYGRVLLKGEYDDFYCDGCSGRIELSHIFRGGGLLFLGCSLLQDRTMALLKEIADNDENMPRHYAFLPKPPSNKKVIDREHFLAQRNVFPIWYDGAHDTDIESFLVGLMEDLKKL